MCDKFPRKFDVQTSYKVEKVIFVVNIKFSRATYHTIVPSTEELDCLNSDQHQISPHCIMTHTGHKNLANDRQT